MKRKILTKIVTKKTWRMKSAKNIKKNIRPYSTKKGDEKFISYALYYNMLIH